MDELDSRTWAIASDVVAVYPVALISDVLIGIVLSSVIYGLWEATYERGFWGKCRVSLLGAGIVIALLSVICGLYSYDDYVYRRCRTIAAQLEEKGANITMALDAPEPAQNSIRSAICGIACRLKTTFTRRYYRSLAYVDLSYVTQSDMNECVALLGEMTCRISLRIPSKGACNYEIPKDTPINCVSSLRFSDEVFVGADIDFLAKLPQMKVLFCMYKAGRSCSLKELQTAQQLEQISISGDAPGNELSYLRQLTSLEVLSINSRLDIATFEEVCQLKRLRILVAPFWSLTRDQELRLRAELPGLICLATSHS